MPARSSLAAAASGLAVVAVLAVLDAAWGATRIITATVVLGPFIAALFGATRATLLVAAGAIATASASFAWNDNLGDVDYVFRLAVVAVGSAFAVLDAQGRARLAGDRARFRLLTAAAALGDTAATVDETVRRVSGLVVPAFADVCLIDVDLGGGRRRLATATSGPGAPDADAAPPGARIVVPLRARGRAFGALTLLRARAWGDADREFARVLAGRVALALDNAGLFSEVEALEARMTAALGALAEAVTIQAADGRFVYANEAAARTLGFASPEEVVATPPDEVTAAFALYAEDGRPLAVEDLPTRRLLAGLPARPLLVRTVHRATGEERWRVTKATAVLDAAGRPQLAVNVIEDVTEVKRAELAQRFLAEAGVVLASSLDYEATLARVAHLAVPQIADRCSVVLAGRDEPGDPLVARVLRDGVAQLADRPGEAAMVVPMTDAAGVLGALAFVNDASRRRFTAVHLEVAEELGRRAGAAVETARLYTERTRIAQTLQLSLLPDELPHIPGFEVASLYRPAGEETFVGGDFYDAIETDAGWMLVVGDVTGRGAQAAALTGEARYTLRTAATLLADPVAAIDHLNRALAAEPELPICTVAVVLLAEEAGRSTATVVCAGHPPPVLVRDGATQLVGLAGPMVGAWEDSTWRSVTVELQEDDLLVLYTDGVTDTVGADGRFGEERLAAAVAGARDADGVVAVVADALRAFERGAQADDTAVVAVRCLAGAEQWRAPAEPGSVAPLRGAVADFAARAGATPAIVDDVRLAVSEALTNVVLHAYREGATGDVHVRASVSGGRIEIVVEDRGIGLTPRPDSPGIGVGLPLIATLAAESDVGAREGGGTVVRMTFPAGGA